METQTQVRQAIAALENNIFVEEERLEQALRHLLFVGDQGTTTEFSSELGAIRELIRARLSSEISIPVDELGNMLERCLGKIER